MRRFRPHTKLHPHGTLLHVARPLPLSYGGRRADKDSHLFLCSMSCKTDESWQHVTANEVTGPVLDHPTSVSPHSRDDGEIATYLSLSLSPHSLPLNSKANYGVRKSQNTNPPLSMRREHSNKYAAHNASVSAMTGTLQLLGPQLLPNHASSRRRRSGANASDPPARHRRCDPHCTGAPTHVRETAKGGDCGKVVGNLWVNHFVDDQRVPQLRQDSEEEDDDEDAAECLQQRRVQRLTCEATTSGPQRPRQAEVTRASDHTQVAAIVHASSSRSPARSVPKGGQLGRLSA